MRCAENHYPLLNVARRLERSEASGPGERFVLWLQGCPLRCLGCWNPDTWDFAERNLMTVEQVMEMIFAVRGIEGVTVTGGEPFAQARALCHLVPRIRSGGLSVMIFTGYQLEELTSGEAGEVLSYTDVLVDGRFILSERNELLTWRGSRNQRVHFLTSRYSGTTPGGERRTEILLGDSGEMHVTGFPDVVLLRELQQNVSGAPERETFMKSAAQ